MTFGSAASGPLTIWRRLATAAGCLLIGAASNASAAAPHRGPAPLATVPIVDLVDGVPVIEVQLGDGPPHRFEFDTGSAELISRPLAQSAGLEARAVTQLVEANNVSRTLQVADADLRLNGLRLGRVPMAIMPAGWESSKASEGTLGRRLLQRYVVTIDFAGRRLVLRRPDGYHPPRGAVVLPLTYGGGFYRTTATVDGYAGAFGLDTGARADVLLFPGFQRAHALDLRYGAAHEAAILYGAAGDESLARVAGGQLLQIGAARVVEPTIGLLPPSPGFAGDASLAGLIGGPALSQLEVTFDAPHGRLILRRTQPDPRLHHGVGFGLESVGGINRVQRVVPGGPGWSAGLRDGDEILAIAGFAIKDLPDELWARFWRGPPGTAVELWTRRKGESLSRTLRYSAWRAS